MSFVVGISTGLAMGIGAGMAIGQKAARDRANRFLQTHNITLQDEWGETIASEEFVERAFGADLDRKRKPLLIALVAGLLLLVLFTTVFFLVGAGST
jgi:hypothetical protein